MGEGIDARGDPSEIVGEEVGDSGFMRVGVGDVDADGALGDALALERMDYATMRG